MTYRDDLEQFNRICHSDALPEMQLVPAEEWQREPVSPRYALGLLALAVVLIGVHALWVARL